MDRTLELYHSLDPDERAAFGFDVTQLNWRHYIQNVHIPGIKRYILKLEGEGAARLDAAARPPRLARPPSPSLLRQSAARFGEKIALQMRRGGDWERVSYAELGARADVGGRTVARCGLRHGDRVSCSPRTSPSGAWRTWAPHRSGSRWFPLDAQTWQNEVWAIARFTGRPRHPRLRELLQALHAGQRPGERACGLAAADPRRERALHPLRDGRVSAQHVRHAAPGGAARAPTSRSTPDDAASIIFTSGTASDPKGAVHTHRGFLANMQGWWPSPRRSGPTTRSVSVLPLYHALEFTCGFLAPLWLGVTITYANSLKPSNLVDTMRETGHHLHDGGADPARADSRRDRAPGAEGRTRRAPRGRCRCQAGPRPAGAPPARPCAAGIARARAR